jgi:hypothetical protein
MADDTYGPRRPTAQIRSSDAEAFQALRTTLEAVLDDWQGHYGVPEPALFAHLLAFAALPLERFYAQYLRWVGDVYNDNVRLHRQLDEVREEGRAMSGALDLCVAERHQLRSTVHQLQEAVGQLQEAVGQLQARLRQRQEGEEEDW